MCCSAWKTEDALFWFFHWVKSWTRKEGVSLLLLVRREEGLFDLGAPHTRVGFNNSSTRSPTLSQSPPSCLLACCADARRRRRKTATDPVDDADHKDFAISSLFVRQHCGIYITFVPQTIQFLKRKPTGVCFHLQLKKEVQFRFTVREERRLFAGWVLPSIQCFGSVTQLIRFLGAWKDFLQSIDRTPPFFSCIWKGQETGKKTEAEADGLRTIGEPHS